MPVLNGYYDLATPFSATEYVMTHLGLPPGLGTRIEMKYYKAGHMIYVHPPSMATTKRDIDAFMAHTKPPVHLLLDTGHARWGGADPAGLARAYRERIGHVHCKDVRDKQMRQSHAGDWSFLDSVLGMGDDLGVYTVPGDGIVDFGAVFRELRGYSGWLVLEAEQDPSKAPSLAYAKKGIAHLKAKLAEAGLD